MKAYGAAVSSAEAPTASGFLAPRCMRRKGGRRLGHNDRRRNVERVVGSEHTAREGHFGFRGVRSRANARGALASASSRRLPRRVALRFRRLTVSGSERGRGDFVARRSRFARDGHARRDHRLRRVCGHRRSCIVRDVERVARAGNRFLARLRCVNLRASRRDLHGGEVWRPSWTGLVKVRREPSSRPRSSAGFRSAVSSDA